MVEAPLPHLCPNQPPPLQRPPAAASIRAHSNPPTSVNTSPHLQPHQLPQPQLHAMDLLAHLPHHILTHGRIKHLEGGLGFGGLGLVFSLRFSRRDYYSIACLLGPVTIFPPSPPLPAPSPAPPPPASSPLGAVSPRPSLARA